MTLGSGLRGKPPGIRAMRTMVHLRGVAHNLSRPASRSVCRAGWDAVSSHVSGIKRAPPFATGLNQRGIPAARGGLKDQRRLVMAAFEVVLGPTLQPLDKGAQDHGPPPVRRCSCGPHAQRAVNAKTLRHVWTPLEEQEKSSRAVWPVVGC